MGELLIVTERGSFIINGAERVVGQLHRSHISFKNRAHERKTLWFPNYSRQRNLD